ncbi:hypothetical protein TBLA_0A01130 [Henningerozyma blattae CBS 6284]|uniref:4-hydroxy-4-methyl-2-oxoglutarate aldolase n=1 Tax=Henningerozyma blattae (strain ATCC 34711 / CBS 6284 / DSM 70876 / NBRC 10599 / NRRL Y-10934 / UCD 77-7) TaxID=1071380 RepID=I2GUW1_HENB6|nr:hypothetical protein TBLA_0A01130 [Tetrapisispora blattae CBS 6284]CCH57913.1 hypothetical protein TBLA_0A01130 [Tetrapisispora blattae CBS 6284]
MDKLKKFTTCDISDGLLNLCKMDDGGFIPNLIFQSSFPDSISKDKANIMIGKAYTVLFAPVDDPRETVNYIDHIPEGSIVMIALDKSLQSRNAPYSKVTNSLYGGLMSARAKYLGAHGTVVFGNIRDVQEHSDLNFPIFSYGTGSCAANKVVKPVACNVPLEILITNPGPTTITVSPGEIIMGDVNGVVHIPYSISSNEISLKSLVNYIEKSIEADEIIKQEILKGSSAKEAMARNRKILKELI